MADKIDVKMSSFVEATEVKDTDNIIILQDGDNKKVKSPRFEQKILDKVGEGFVRVGEKIPSENLTFGEVKEGNTNVVSGDEVFETVFGSYDTNLYSFMVNKGKRYPFEGFVKEDVTNTIRFKNAILDCFIKTNDEYMYNYTISLLAINHDVFGNRIDIRRKRVSDNATVNTFSFRTKGQDATLDFIYELDKLQSKKLVNIFLENDDIAINIIIDTSEFLNQELINMYDNTWKDFIILKSCFYTKGINVKKEIDTINKRIDNILSNDTLIKASNWSAKIENRESYLRSEYQKKIDNNPNFKPEFYGVEWNEKHVSPSQVVRVGYQDLHKTLPIQSKIRRCIVKNNIVQYYLDVNNSNLKVNGEIARLDGTDGDVMVEIPEFFYKAQEYGTDNSVKRVDISEEAIPDYVYSPKFYLAAYECTVNRDNNVLSSVCTTNFNIEEKELFIENASRYVKGDSGFSLGVQKLYSINNYTENATTYRGNVNDSSLDNQLTPTDANYSRNNLGRPIANINRTEAKKYASNGNKLIQQYDAQKALYMLVMIEYATRQIQAPIMSKTAEGYAQGGLGQGAVKYPDYAGYEKFFSPQGGTAVVPIGVTNELGNNSGEVYFEIKNCPIRSTGSGSDAVITEYGSVYMPVNSYRGVENFYGHLYKIVDNIDSIITYLPNTGGQRKNEYFYQKNPYLTTDNGNLSTYKKIGESTFLSSIKPVKNLLWGDKGHILPIGSNDSNNYNEYYCDCVEHVTGWNGNNDGTVKYLTYNGRAVSNQLVGLLFSVIAVDVVGGRKRTSDTVRIQTF